LRIPNNKLLSKQLQDYTLTHNGRLIYNNWLLPQDTMNKKRDHDLIIQCIQRARQDDDAKYEVNSENDNSVLLYYIEKDNCSVSKISDDSTRICDTISTSSQHCYFDVDKLSGDDGTSKTRSRTSSITINSSEIANNEDTLPKSFLQLQGISIANYNMACNFHIGAALKIMLHHKIHILAIQEHTAWNRNLSEGESNSFKSHCDNYGYLIIIAKLQIVILDKQLQACLRETSIEEEGHLIRCHLEISHNRFATLIAVYGIPHHGGEKLPQSNRDTGENSVLQRMTNVREQTKNFIKMAKDNNNLVYVFGDLQDTPDNSKNFNLGKCQLPKDPLGIVRLCEEWNLSCTIYQHMHSLKKTYCFKAWLKRRKIHRWHVCLQ
jgi:hypothetical protein